MNNAENPISNIEKPIIVTYAVRLIYVSLGVGVFRLIPDFLSVNIGVLIESSDFFWFLVFSSIFGVSISLTVFLAVGINSGKNWARIVFVLFFAADLIFFILAWQMIFSSSIAGLLRTIQAGLQSIAIYILFQSESNQWFYLQKQTKLATEANKTQDSCSIRLCNYVFTLTYAISVLGIVIIIGIISFVFLEGKQREDILGVVADGFFWFCLGLTTGPSISSLVISFLMEMLFCNIYSAIATLIASIVSISCAIWFYRYIFIISPTTDTTALGFFIMPPIQLGLYFFVFINGLSILWLLIWLIDKLLSSAKEPVNNPN